MLLSEKARRGKTRHERKYGRMKRENRHTFIHRLFGY